MRIGVDIDNVLSKFNEKLLEEYLLHDRVLRNTGIINKNADYIRNGMFDWSKDEEEKFYHENIERMAYNFEMVEDASKYIKRLIEDGNEIYIITGRNNGEYSDPYNMTVEWLKKYDIPYTKLILTNAYDFHQKTEVCLENNIKIMIDDSSKVCIDANENGIKSLLMNTPYNQKVMKVNRVYNWKEIYEYINKL